MQPKNKNEYKTKTKSVLEFAYTEDCNFYNRQSMEDDHFAFDDFFNDGETGLFGVLDGHGGKEVPRFCTKSIPEQFDKYIGDYENNIEKLF
mmetsp:Transcript_3709/g.3142  ORF Transcript_3709/g.3142 Transcript_3709/m.3142 type:complete len:91 (+) Transcript_3709:101-373(+)